jgi:hypothetical protein
MNLIRIALILLVGWLIARLIKHYLDKIQNGPTELVKCPKCQTYISKGSKHSCAPPNGNSAASCFLLFLVLGLLPGLAHADGGGRYLIEVSGQYIDVGLEVNDIPVLAWQIERQATAGASLNHWLRRGKNTMRLTIRAHGTGQASALAKIFFVGGAKNGQQQLVSMLEIKDYRQAQNGVPFSFNLASAPDLALWHGQKPSQAISPETARALVATFRQQMISALLAGGSLNDVALLADERADYAKAFGAPATSGAIALASQKNACWWSGIQACRPQRGSDSTSWRYRPLSLGSQGRAVVGACSG